MRSGRAFLGLAVVLGTRQAFVARGSGGGGGGLVDLVVVAIAVVLSVISWYVTTWRVDGDTVQVATGLIRRNTVRVPLARVQAVDLIEPFLARLLGLAEVRLRTAGGTGGDARLQYLKIEEATRVRAGLLAMAHGLPHTTPPPPERPLFHISNPRLVASLVLTGPAIVALVLLLFAFAVAVSRAVPAAVLGAAGGTLVLDIVAVASRMVRRVAAEWDFEVAEAPDGLRIRSGFASRAAETIPYGRVQAVRKVEPLWWRPFGWCRLELHLAGAVHRGTGQPRAVLRRALLPVGDCDQAEWLLGRVVFHHDVSLGPPPRRAAVRAPFSYHYLAAGRNESCAVSVRGRVRRTTEWVPLGKVQSIRYGQGPLQRLLKLASLHLDVAGRNASMPWWHRSATEAAELMKTLPADCQAARDSDTALARTRAGAGTAPPVQTPGSLEGPPLPAPVGPPASGPLAPAPDPPPRA